jgi:hypothetical protein
LIYHSRLRGISRHFPSVVRTLAFAAIAGANSTADAQLRPLEPISWRVFDTGVAITGDAQVAWYKDQRASLAGTEGDLWEVPTLSLAWRNGRIAILASGTGQRFFTERKRFAPPYFGVRPTSNGKRHDSGAYTLGTAVRLTPESNRLEGLLRFGTRLPTTDNETGLDRDAIDFFATLAARTRRGPLSLALEGGLGINTTRDSVFEQDDLFLYAARFEYEGRIVTPSLVVVGQEHGPAHHEIRGVEDLSEIRFGLRFGDRKWIRIEGIRGLADFSPSYGLSLAVGLVR